MCPFKGTTWNQSETIGIVTLQKPDISPAFEAKFHHHLACSNCFIVHGYGSQGRHYRQGSETDHVCQRNILLVARKLKSLSDWVKVRPRPNQVIEKCIIKCDILIQTR